MREEATVERSPSGSGRGRRSPGDGDRASADGDLAQEDVVVPPGLEALQTVADGVDRHAVVRPQLRLVLPDHPLQLFVLGLLHLRIGNATIGHELLDLGSSKRVSFSAPILVNHWPKYQSGSWGMCAQPE